MMYLNDSDNDLFDDRNGMQRLVESSRLRKREQKEDDKLNDLKRRTREAQEQFKARLGPDGDKRGASEEKQENGLEALRRRFS